MAELSKTQIKKRTRKLLEKLECIKAELEEFKDDVENESYNIDPYDGESDLTPVQAERLKSWLENVGYALDDLINNMDTDELEGYMEE